MSLSETISPLIGRWLIAWFYITGPRHLMANRHDVLEQILARQVPLPPLVLMVVLVLVLLGAVSLMFGYQARHGAVILFGVTFAAAFLMHDYWHVADPGLRETELQLFLRDIAICGVLLLVIGLGPVPFAVDGKPAARKEGGHGKKI